MAFITAVTDVQDSTGTSVVVLNSDGTRPPLTIKFSTGLTPTYTKVNGVGVITLVANAGSAAAAEAATPSTLLLRSNTGKGYLVGLDAGAAGITNTSGVTGNAVLILTAGTSVQLGVKLDANNKAIEKVTYAQFTAGAAPGAPGAGSARVYEDTDLGLVRKDSGGNVASLLARPILHRVVFAAGAAHTAAATALGANPALAAVTTLVDVSSQTDVTSTWTPPAGVVWTNVVVHSLGGFLHAAAPLTVDWEITTSGASLFPGAALDFTAGQLTGTVTSTTWTGSGIGAVSLPGAGTSLLVGGTTVSIRAFAGSTIDDGSGALLLEGYIP